MRTLAFVKYEGLGNDFIVVDGAPTLLTRDEVIRLCDRHRGVGADGVLFGGVSAIGRAFMHVVNADGSHAEMCGNGLRCVALHLAERGLAPWDTTFEVDTDAGPHACRVERPTGDGEARVEVSMRAPSLAPTDVPVAAPAALVDAPVAVLGRTLHVTGVSMGNPHAVVFDDVGDARRELGPELQAAPLFPAKANVGFAMLEGPSALRLHVYERGAGWTEACGTGACAAAVAAVETGRAPRGVPLTVTLPGGPLRIVVGAPGKRLSMTGGARRVFEGSVRLR